ncbi:MAG: hypothetical protein KGH80_06100 [Xanthomonadaceae bacterium]|nr:hypothetical protein [Xanthomonadaceae bacterium]
METTLNYQITYPPQAAARSAVVADPNAPLFASEDGLASSLSSQECVFQIKRSGETHVMTYQVLRALDQCREFRSLDEHAARIESTIAGLAGKRDDIKRVLDSLTQRRLLISDDQFVERLTRAPARTPAELRGIFIRACDRPAQLSRLLASLSDYERRHRGGRRYTVLDDSSLPAHANEQRDLLREFARTTGCKVHYVGRAEAAKLAERLGKAVPAARTAAQRLLLRDAQQHSQRFGGGRGWNLAMLLSAGARLALLDDDLLLPLRRPEYARPGLDPNPAALAHARFPSSMEEALASGEEVAGDAFALDMECCGQALGAVLATRYPVERAALRGMNLGRLDNLVETSRIVATLHGSRGSSRTENALWLYQLDVQSRAEFWQERASYQRHVDAQHVVHTVAQARVVPYANFTPFMLDNAALLPCTNPVGRGEDSLAGALTRFCDPDALALEMPESIGHWQETARRRADKTLAANLPRVNHFLRDFVQRQYGLFQAEDPAARMGMLVHVLRDMAGASENARIAHLREYLSYVRANIIDNLQHQIEGVPEAPVWWLADAREVVQANAKALLANAPPRLGDWAEDIDAPGCARALAQECNALADCCEHWPALWAHAAEQGDKLLAQA